MCSATGFCIHIVNLGTRNVFMCGKCMDSKKSNLRLNIFGVAFVSPFGGYCAPLQYHAVTAVERLDLDPKLSQGRDSDTPLLSLPSSQNVEKLWPDLFQGSCSRSYFNTGKLKKV